jgi:hypothetical protein
VYDTFAAKPSLPGEFSKNSFKNVPLWRGQGLPAETKCRQGRLIKLFFENFLCNFSKGVRTKKIIIAQKSGE